MTNYIIAHDVGTGGNKATLVDPAGRVCGSVFEPYETHYPRLHWAEQEPADWWRAVTMSTRRLLEQTGVRPADVLGLTFSYQMLGVVPVDGAGEVLRPAIIWLDGRAQEQAQQIMRKVGGPKLFAYVVGCAATGKDVLPKLLWLKQEEPELFRRTSLFLDVGGYLRYRCTGHMVSDWTEASATGLFSLKKKSWDTFLMRYFGLPREKFPPLVRSTDQVGTLTAEAATACGLLEGTPVVAGSGDVTAAAVGAGAVGEGEGHICLGTSGWVGVVTERIVTGKHGIASIQAADPAKCFLIAETETAGACLKWIAEQFYRKEQEEVENVYALMDEVVEQVEAGAGFLLFTPWMYGERCPVADVHVRSAFLNLSADHRREHMLRAVYEGVAYNLRWMLELVSGLYGFQLPVLRLIGGGARGAPWMQILADVTGKQVETVANPLEAGAVGAALVAAVGLGMYPGFPALKEVVQVARVFEPNAANAAVYDALFGIYKQVYRSLRGAYRRLSAARSEYGIGK
ncbi:MAG: FGGY-family carbohydrate kinase [Anaerolineae bacterium]|nr:FGGY-family carbohydrate kinase [Anaerolineae bacterium]